MGPPAPKRSKREAGRNAEAKIDAYQQEAREGTPAYLDRVNELAAAKEELAFQAKFQKEAARMRPNNPARAHLFTTAEALPDLPLLPFSLTSTHRARNPRQYRYST